MKYSLATILATRILLRSNRINANLTHRTLDIYTFFYILNKKRLL